MIELIKEEFELKELILPTGLDVVPAPDGSFAQSLVWLVQRPHTLLISGPTGSPGCPGLTSCRFLQAGQPFLLHHPQCARSLQPSTLQVGALICFFPSGATQLSMPTILDLEPEEEDLPAGVLPDVPVLGLLFATVLTNLGNLLEPELVLPPSFTFFLSSSSFSFFPIISRLRFSRVW